MKLTASSFINAYIRASLTSKFKLPYGVDCTCPWLWFDGLFIYDLDDLI